MAGVCRPYFVKKTESTKRFSVDVIFNDDHTNIIIDMQNVTDREVEDITDGIRSQWEFENKPKPVTKGYKTLADIADSLDDAITQLRSLIENHQPWDTTP